MNFTQTQLLEAHFYWPLELIKDYPVEIASVMLDSVFNNEIYQANLALFSQQHMLETINNLRSCVTHAQPQNRNSSYPYVKTLPDMVAYRLTERDIETRFPKKIILRNGATISVAPPDLICDIYAPGVSARNAYTVAAQEPAGLINLTSAGPCEKYEVLSWIKNKLDSTKSELHYKTQPDYQYAENLLDLILAGLDTVTETQIIEKALTAFRSCPAPMKQTIVKKIQYHLYDHPTFSCKKNEPQHTYYPRAEKYLIKLLQTHLDSVTADESVLQHLRQVSLQQKAQVSGLLEETQHMKTQLQKKLCSEASPCLLQPVAIEVQWLALLYNNTFQACACCAKDSASPPTFLSELNNYRNKIQQINHLNQALTTHEVHINNIHARRGNHQEHTRDKKRLQNWLAEIRVRNFLGAIAIYEEINNEPWFNPNIVDRYGKSAVDYALLHQTFLFLYFLGQHSITHITMNYRQLARADVVLSLENSTDQQITQQILITEFNLIIFRLLRLAQPISLDNIRMTFIAYRIMPALHTNLWENFCRQALLEIEKELNDFIYGNTPGDLAVYSAIFNALHQSQRFDELLQMHLDSAIYLLKQYWENGNFDSDWTDNNILRRFHLLNKIELIQTTKVNYTHTLNKRLVEMLTKNSGDVNNPIVQSLKKIYERLTDLDGFDHTLQQFQEEYAAQRENHRQSEQFMIPDTLLQALYQKITHYNNNTGCLNFHMRIKASALEQALATALLNINKIHNITEFLNFTLDAARQTSIKTVLQKPRLWPGSKPIYGATQSWREIAAIVNDLERPQIHDAPPRQVGLG